ncbi:MAG: dual specificity protein phosphatase family protein [Gemmataceae bacterium]
MWLIVDRLYLGDREDAENLVGLQKEGITHVINCTRMPCFYPDHFNYLHLELDDPDPRFGALIPEVCAYIDEARGKGKVMVHCAAAVSRSPSVILAYLSHQGQSLSTAWDFLLDRAPQVNPAALFWHQLVEHYGPGPTNGLFEPDLMQ